MGADNFLQAIDLPAAPALHRPKGKPPDSNEDVDGTHKVPGGKCRSALWRRDQQVEPDSADSSVVEPSVPCGARPSSSAQRRHMLQILPALLRAPFVAGLVLGGHQRVWAAAPLRLEVKRAG